MTTWSNSPEFHRIMEILTDYWLSCPDEAEVTVCMTFRDASGNMQNKRVIWNNPQLRKHGKNTKLLKLKKLSEVIAPRNAACTGSCMS